jgi:hypothetical protein
MMMIVVLLILSIRNTVVIIRLLIAMIIMNVPPIGAMKFANMNILIARIIMNVPLMIAIARLVVLILQFLMIIVMIRVLVPLNIAMITKVAYGRMLNVKITAFVQLTGVILLKVVS